MWYFVVFRFWGLWVGSLLRSLALGLKISDAPGRSALNYSWVVGVNLGTLRNPVRQAGRHPFMLRLLGTP